MERTPMATLRTYDNVAVSPHEFDASVGWASIPRPLLVDWLTLLERVTQVLAPGYAAPALPDPIVFEQETIASDGPYGSSENFYYLSYFSLQLDGLLVSFERGRQEDGEPLGMATTGLPYNVSSYMADNAKGPAKARFFVWHDDGQTGAIAAVLGVPPEPLR